MIYCHTSVISHEIEFLISYERGPDGKDALVVKTFRDGVPLGIVRQRRIFMPALDPNLIDVEAWHLGAVRLTSQNIAAIKRDVLAAVNRMRQRAIAAGILNSQGEPI